MNETNEWGSKITYDISEDGNRMAVVAADELQLYQIKTDGSLISTGKIMLPGVAIGITLSGNLAITWDSAYVYVLDISDPNMYHILSTVPRSMETIVDCIVSDNLLYVATGGVYDFGSLRIYSLSDPTLPRYVGDITLPYDEMVMSMGKSGDTVYLTGMGPDPDWPYNSQDYYCTKMWAIDVSNPADPVLLDIFHKSSTGCASKPAISGHVAILGIYTVQPDEAGFLLTVDVSDPTHMAELGDVHVEPLGNSEISAGVVVKNDTALIGLGDGGIQQVDISDPSNPVVLTHCSQGGFLRALSWSGTHAYAVNLNEGVFRVDHPTDPGMSMTPLFPDHKLTGQTKGIVAQGPTMLVAQDRVGVRVLNISNPDNPIEKAILFPDSRPTAVAIDGTIGVVSFKLKTPSSSLSFFDLSDPSNPVALGHSSTGEGVYDLEMGNGFLIACNLNHAFIYDVRDPANPQYLTSYGTVGYAGASISGSYATVADGGNIRILDLSTPGEVSVLYSEPGISYFNKAFDFDGTNIYMLNATTGGAAYIMNWTYPDQLQYVSTISSVEGQGSSVLLVDHNRLYTNSGGTGSNVFDVTNPATPVRIGGDTSAAYFSSIAKAQNRIFAEQQFYGTVKTLKETTIPGADLYVLSADVSDGNGSISPFGVTTIEAGNSIDIAADPDPGWIFSHWSGDATGTENPLTVTMSGNKTIHAVFEASDDHVAPGVPTNLYVSQANPNQVKLRFSAALDNEGGTGVWRYHVYRRDLNPAEHNSHLSRTELGTTTSISFVDENAPRAQTILYSVVAEDYAGNLSSESEIIWLDIPGFDNQAPSVPANLKAAVTGDETMSVQLSWLLAGDDSSGISVYEIFRQETAPAASEDPFAVARYTEWEDVDIQTSHTYTYWVRSRDLAGNVSAPVSVNISVPLIGQQETEHIIYFPHLASDTNWWTGFALVNPSDAPANIRFEFFDSDGTLVRTLEAPTTLNAGEKIVSTIANLFDGDVPEGAAWWRVISDQPLEGFELFGRPSNDNTTDEMVGVKIAKTASTRLLFPIVQVNETDWTGLALANTNTSTPANVTFRAYNESGNLLETSAAVQVPALGKTVKLAESYFNGETLPAGTTSVVMESDQPCIGFELFGRKDQTCLAGVSAVVLPSELDQKNSLSRVVFVKGDKTKSYPFRYQIPRTNVSGSETERFQIVNPTDASANLIIQYRYEDGTEKNVMYSVNSMGSMSVPVQLDGVSSQPVSIVVQSTGELSVCEIFEDQTQGYFDCLFAISDGPKAVNITHIAPETTYWNSNVCLFNPTPYYNEVKVSVYTPSGTLANLQLSRKSNPFTLTLKPFEFINDEIHQLISSDSDIQNIGWIKAEGQFPINGYFTFGTKNGSKMSAIELGNQ